MSRTLLVIGYFIVFYNILPLILGYSHLFFKVDCEYSKKGTVVDPVCFISKHGLRFGVRFTKELNVFNFNLTSFFKVGNKYRQIFKMPVFDYCAYMRSSNKNPIVKMMMGFLNGSAPRVMHECPYKDRIDFVNFSIAGNYKIFPDGVYKNTFSCSDELNEFLFQLTTHSNITSEIKHLR